nr:capsid protein [Rat picobirnavirus]
MNAKQQQRAKRFSRNNNKDKDFRQDSTDNRYSKGAPSKVTVETTHGYNDVSWYAKNTQLLEDAASYSYGTPLGAKLPNLYADNTVNPPTIAVPGLLAYNILIGPGLSTDSSSPANMAANNIYAYTRYMNSGAKNYDQADQMLYILAMDSLYAAWNWCKRIYGYMSTYSQVNRYMPRAYAKADGVDFDDILSNLANFREWLNTIAAQISSFCVPGTMSFCVRHSWMFSNIYKDSEVLKAQQYMFVPAGFYMYNETGSEYGGQLVFQPIEHASGAPLTFKMLQNKLKAMIDAVAYSEDIGIMSGDILKAYGQGSLFKITAVDPSYSILPIYNEEVLNQMHNSSLCPFTTNPSSSPSYTSTWNITQNPDTGFLIWDPWYDVIQNEKARTKFMLNMPWENPTPANNMVASRLTAMWAYGSVPGQTSKMGSHLVHAGSEVVVQRMIFYFSTAGNNGWDIVGDIRTTESIFFGSGAPSSATIQYLALVTNFDWHPLVPVLSQPSGTLPTLVGLVGDISNYTIIGENELSMMHLTALLSEFNVPQIGSF